MLCEKCQKEVEIGAWPFCPHPAASTAMIAGDECDVVIRHGACWPDGTPRRYRSKAEIKRVAFEAGWTQGYDTPKLNQRLVEKEQQVSEKRRKEWQR